MSDADTLRAELEDLSGDFPPDRDGLPLVVDRDDRIVWVVGQSVAEDFRVTAPEKGVILLKARRLGGVG